MTALDKLVKAAEEALYRAGFIGDRKEIAQIAVAAMLRALPESEAVERTLANELGRYRSEGPSCRFIPNLVAAKAVANALARLAGEVKK